MTEPSWSEALYGPLPLAGEQLQSRFLRLRPGVGDAPLRCKLFTSTLLAATYEALSYTWGTDKGTNPVQVNGVDVGVTSNLQAALLALRQPKKSRVMWIDALCINQTDLHERSHQVQQMGHIYRCAHKVVIWLGEGSDPSTRFASAWPDEKLKVVISQCVASVRCWGVGTGLVCGEHHVNSCESKSSRY